MTEKQKRFCDEYIIDCNATQAAIRAGYSPNGINKRVTRMMANEGIQQYLSERMKSKENELIASQDEVLKYLTSVMRGKSTASEIVVEGIGEGMSEARIINKPPSEKERIRAAELLGNRYGAFKDQEERELKKLKTEQEIERLRRQNNGNNDEDDGVTLVYD